MPEDLSRLTLTTSLVDEASGPLQRLKQEVNRSLDSMADATVKTAAGMGKAAGGIASAFSAAGGGIMSVAKVIGGGMAMVGRGIMSVATEATKAAGIAATALLTTGLIKAQEYISKGFQRVTAIQDATAQSAVLMGGDIQKAAGFIEQIRDVVTGTPFSLPDFAKAGQEMLMYGIEAEKIPGILTAVGEATAGSGAKAVENASQMSTVMSKMAAVGKVQLDDMWSMAAVGVPALTILANHFGKTTTEMQDMISYGTVPAKEAIDALTKGIMEGSNGVAGATQSYQGSMAALAKTWSGSLMIFESSKAILGAKFIDPLKDAMPGIVNGMTEINRSLAVFAPAWAAWLGKSGALTPGAGPIPYLEGTLRNIAEHIRDFGNNGGLQAFVAQMKELAPVVAPVAAALGAMSLTSFAGMLGPLGAMLPTINPVLAAIVALLAVSPELRAVMTDTFNQILAALRPLFPLFQQLGGELMQVLNESLKALAPALGGVLTAIVPIIPMFLQMAMILIDSLAPILPVIINFVGAVATMLAENLAAAILQLVPPLIGFINQLIDRLSPILPVIFGALVQLLQIFMPLIPVIADIAGMVLQLATQFIVALLPPLLELIPLFLDLAKTIGGAVMTVLMAIMPPLFDLLMALMPIIPPLGELIGLFVKLAIDVLTPLLPIITEVARVVADVLTLALKDAIPFLKDLITHAVDLTKALVEQLKPILSVIGGMFKGIGDFVHDVVRGIGDFIKSGWDQVTGFIKFITGQASGGGMAKAMGGGFVVRHFAEGGVLSGYSPGKDTVPAMLSPGEAILVPELVRALGASNIMAANFAYSHGRPAMEGSPDRTGGSPSGLLGGGGTTVTVIVSAGAVQINTNGTVNADDIRDGLTAALEDAARRAY